MEEKDQLREIFDRAPDSITLINRDYVYEMVNESYCRAVGKRKEEILGSTVAQVWGERLFGSPIKKYLDKCFTGDSVRYESKFDFGPQQKFMYVSYYPQYEDGIVVRALVFSTDVSPIKDLERRLKQYRFKDPTTGLFNRRSLRVILNTELAKARRSRTEKLRALLLISLEDFARVNQTNGHHVGDVLLESSGLRIKESVRDSDVVFRFEGKELAALLTNLT